MVGWWGGGLFDYSVSPGPVFWEFDTEFWVQSLDLDLDLDLDTGPDLELDNFQELHLPTENWQESVFLKKKTLFKTHMFKHNSVCKSM